MFSRNKFKTDESIEAGKLMADPETRKTIITTAQGLDETYQKYLTHENRKLVTKETMKYKSYEYITDNMRSAYRNQNAE